MPRPGALPGSDRYAKVSSAAHSARALLRVTRGGATESKIAVGAGVAQLVEHLICNQRVGGSSPFASSSSRSAKRKMDLVVLLDRSGVADLRSFLQGWCPARFASGIDDGLDGLS